MTSVAGLAKVLDLVARAGGLGARLSAAPEASLIELDVLARHAARGNGGARDVLVAFAFLRATHAHLPIEALHAAATAGGLARAAELLRSDGPFRTMGAHGHLAEPSAPIGAVYRYEEGLRDLSLPRFAARVRFDRERILRDPRPQVFAHLLAHDALGLAEVLRVASRRPLTKEIARTIVGSRWLGQQRVREALVANPFVETWLALVLLPTVGASILQGAHVDPALPAFAASLRATA